MKRFTDKTVQFFNGEVVKRIKRIILFIFIILVVLDVIFVGVKGFPTISLVIHNSSPRFMVLIWLFGLFVTNLFFQRSANNKPAKTIGNFFVLAGITLFFLVAGLLIKQPGEAITCENYTIEIEKWETPYMTRILCHDCSKGASEMKNCDCQNLSCNENTHFKLDLTVGMKFLILAIGILFGYWLWPALPEQIG